METKIRVIQPESCCRDVREPDAMSDASRDAVLGALKALADGTRFEVFRLIAAQQDEICACDIVDRFSVSQPTIAHHLKVLREAGLITSTKRGIWAYYALTTEGASLLQNLAGIVGIKQAVLA